MIIKSLELSCFRNYDFLNLEFDRGTNILFGDNAQGKTNILEAIYLCATTKSHKGSKDKDIVKFDAQEAHIRSYLEKDGIERRIDMHLRKNKSKGIAVDQVRLKKAAELLGLMNVVFFFSGGSFHHQKRARGTAAFCRYGIVSAGFFLSLQSESL